MRRGAGLTRRGWGLLAVALALGASAYLFGLDELYPLGAGSLILVVAARGWVANSTWDVRISRTIRPSRLPEGAEARVHVTARNQDRRRSPVVVVRDRFEGGRVAAAFAVAPLEPGEARGASYRLPAVRRGLYRLVALEVELCDPFGLARVTRVGAPGGSLTVHPRIESLIHGSIPSDSERDRRVPLPVLGRGGDEFYGLREYAPGDDLRRVHWVSTARVDELMIRQPENLWRGRTTIVVDTRSHAHSSQTFEGSLSAAATLAVATLRSGMQARLVLTGGVDTGYGNGTGHEATILDTLAVSEPRRGEGLSDELRFARLSGPLVLITSDMTTADEIGAVLRTAGRSSAAVVVFARERRRESVAGDEARASARTSKWRQVVVQPGMSFRAAWIGAGKVGVRC
ncbi:MAG TPA: DUF58 domain-containing protein [Acidimicrobiales bacterium]